MIIKKDKQSHSTGTFTPSNMLKYSGKGLPTFRSSWELKFMRWCDLNSNIIRWGSENLVIPYKDPTRGLSTHRYYVDFFIETRCRNNEVKKYVIEIKPYSQVIQPQKTYRSSDSAFQERIQLYMRNLSKWKAANEFAKARGFEFKIITEKELFGRK
jgi:hypothetical protein